MILQLLHSEFSYIRGKFDFLFYQCTVQWNPSGGRWNYYLWSKKYVMSPNGWTLTNTMHNLWSAQHKLIPVLWLVKHKLIPCLWLAKRKLVRLSIIYSSSKLLIGWAQTYSRRFIEFAQACSRDLIEQGYQPIMASDWLTRTGLRPLIGWPAWSGMFGLGSGLGWLGSTSQKYLTMLKKFRVYCILYMSVSNSRELFAENLPFWKQVCFTFRHWWLIRYMAG